MRNKIRGGTHMQDRNPETNTESQAPETEPQHEPPDIISSERALELQKEASRVFLHALEEVTSKYVKEYGGSEIGGPQTTRDEQLQAELLYNVMIGLTGAFATLAIFNEIPLGNLARDIIEAYQVANRVFTP
jgi:hypothetical protein